MKDRIFAYLRGVDVKIGFFHDPRWAGENDDHHISLNPRHDILSAAVHEAIHGIEPNFSEEQVLKREKWLVERFTCCDWKTILEIVNSKINRAPARKRRR